MFKMRHLSASFRKAVPMFSDFLSDIGRKACRKVSAVAGHHFLSPGWESVQGRETGNTS
jgi:hypothetical protein